MENGTIIAIALALIAFGIVRRVRAAAGSASPETIRTFLDQGAALVDVRSPEEFSQDHYPGARNIPLTLIAERAKELGSTDTPVILYCNSGSRSAPALRQLKRLGFQKTVNAGGLSRLRGIL